MTCGPITDAITYYIMLLDVKIGKGKQNKATVDINYVTMEVSKMDHLHVFCRIKVFFSLPLSHSLSLSKKKIKKIR